MSDMGGIGHGGAPAAPPAPAPGTLRRIFRRGPWENAATAMVALGVIMLMQPFSLLLYSYSFNLLLAGVIMFLVVTKFPA